jgi:hypothetical protein
MSSLTQKIDLPSKLGFLTEDGRKKKRRNAEEGAQLLSQFEVRESVCACRRDEEKDVSRR